MWHCTLGNSPPSSSAQLFSAVSIEVGFLATLKLTMEATRTGVRKRSGSKAVDNASTESTVAAVKKEHGSAQPDISSSSNAAVARDLQTPSPRMIAPRARVPVDSKCTEPKHGKNEARSEEPPAALTFASLLSTAHTTEMRCGAWDEDGDSSEILCDSECVAGLSGQTIPPAPPLPPCPMRRKRSLSDADHSALYVSYTALCLFYYLLQSIVPFAHVFFCLLFRRLLRPWFPVSRTGHNPPQTAPLRHPPYA